MINQITMAEEQTNWAATAVRVELWYMLARKRLYSCENLGMLRGLH
jgi:hypothetical protein